MTIRKRYDEAADLIARGLYEPALIILLVAVAAAAERQRKAATKGAKKQIGDDKKWFVEYVNSRLQFGVGEQLYKDLRCEVLHEAIIDDKKFSAENFAIQIRKDRLTFGINFLHSLMDLIRLDPLGRNDFRDLLTEFDNLVHYTSPQPHEEFKTEMVARHNITPMRYEMLVEIVQRLRPEKLRAMRPAEMDAILQSKYLPNFRLPVALYARTVETARMFDEHHHLTPEGYRAIQELAANCSTFDLKAEA